MAEVNPKPTKRAVLYPTFKCNAKCKFCYEKYSGRWGQEKTLDTVKQEILGIKARGCNSMDISGGESTIYPHIVEVVKFALENGITTRIITNGLLGEKKTQDLLDSGLDSWFVSVHGLEESHDKMVGIVGARKTQLRFLDQIRGKNTLMFNCVIHGCNFNELPELSTWMREYYPQAVNFINFNPHNNWGSHEEEAKEFIADLRDVESKLNSAISILEYKGVGVNVRYYPMCRISEEYRRCICNDRHVMFDPMEWDYSEMPKTYEQYNAWGIRTSYNIEEKGEPCNKCKLQNICGGINKILNKFTGGKMVDPVYNIGGIDPNDFYYYRKFNVKTLQERV